MPALPDVTAIAADHREGLDALRRVETSYQPVSAVYLWIADCYGLLGEPKLAQDAAQRAKEIQSSSGFHYYVLGEFYTHHGRPDKAVESYELAFSKEPDDHLALLGYGIVLERCQRHEAAESMLTGAIAVNRNTSIAYMARANCRIRRRNWDLAERDLLMALKLDPESWRTYAALAQFHRFRGNYARALEAFDKALALNPRSRAVYDWRGETHATFGRHENAAEDYTRCIQILGDRVAVKSEQRILMRPQLDAWRTQLVDAYCGRAFARAALGQLADASKDIASAEAIGLDNAAAKTEVADFLATSPAVRLRNPRRAVELAKEAVALRPTTGECWRTLGVAHYRAGNCPDAVAALDRSMAIEHTPSGRVWFYLAMSHQQLGDKQQARRYYDMALKWMAEDTPSNANLSELRDEAAQLLGIPDKPPAENEKTEKAK